MALQPLPASPLDAETASDEKRNIEVLQSVVAWYASNPSRISRGGVRLRQLAAQLRRLVDDRPAPCLSGTLKEVAQVVVNAVENLDDATIESGSHIVEACVHNESDSLIITLCPTRAGSRQFAQYVVSFTQTYP